MVEMERSLELKKHVATIHSSNKLTLVQRKIANALLFNAYDDLLGKDEYQIHIKTLCNLIGYDSNDYKTIKRALVNLLSTVIEWNLVDGNKLDMGGVWNASSIIADASIEGAICTYSYSNKMKKLLYSPELYGRLNMVVQAKFQSTYGLALYENCIRFQNIDQTPWFEIVKFRKLMGVEDNKYLVFRDFKRRVLDKAIEEVNKYSPIYLIAQYQKKGRQIKAIQFLIKRTSDLGANGERSPNELLLPPTLSIILKNNFGLSRHQIEETLSLYEEGYIREKIAIIEESPSFLNGKISNLAKYLMHALEGDYQAKKSSKAQQGVLAKPIEHKANLAKQPSAFPIEYKRYLHKLLIEKFLNQPNHDRKQILKEFELNLGNSLYFDIYKRDGLKNILVADQLCEYIKSKLPEWLSDMMRYEDFVLSRST